LPLSAKLTDEDVGDVIEAVRGIIKSNVEDGGIKIMREIKKEYVVTDDNRKRAVLIDIETFEKIEEILESFGLGRYMEEVETEEALSSDIARKYYNTLKKEST